MGNEEGVSATLKFLNTCREDLWGCMWTLRRRADHPGRFFHFDAICLISAPNEAYRAQFVAARGRGEGVVARSILIRAKLRRSIFLRRIKLAPRPFLRALVHPRLGCRCTLSPLFPAPRRGSRVRCRPGSPFPPTVHRRPTYLPPRSETARVENAELGGER